jgi:hypothetical protein
MNSMLNNACISALLCGAVVVAVPAFSQTVGAGPTGAISGPTENTATGTVNTATATNPPRSFAQNNQNNAGASVSTGGVSATGDVNGADASNNAASVNHSTQSSTTGSASASAH